MRTGTLLVVFAILTSPVSGQETTLFDPARHSLTPAGARGKSQRAEKGKFAKLQWKPGAKRLMEALVQHKPPLLAFDDGARLKIEVNTDGYPGLTSFGVRVLDANDETYQFGGLTIPKGDGWKSITVRLDKAEQRQHWGGSDAGRHRLDKPVRLLALLFMAPEEVITQPRYVEVGTVTRNAFDPARVAAEAKLRAIDVEFTTAFRLNIIEVGKEDSSRFVLSNAEDGKVQIFDFVVEFTDMYEQTAHLKRSGITLQAGQTKEIALGRTLARTGWYEAQPRLVLHGEQVSCAKPTVTLAYMKPTGPRAHPPADGFWFGFDARIKDVESHRWLAEAAALVGADFVRGGVTWPGIQPDRADEFNWDRHLALLEMINGQGLGIHYGLSFTPAWAARDKYREELKPTETITATGRRGARLRAAQLKKYAAALSRTPPRADAWRAYLKAALEKNRGHNVFAYEVWNEPDIGFWRGTTEEYLEILRIAGEEIMAADPDAYVFSGFAQFQHHGHEQNPDLMRRSYLELQDSYNTLGLHRHGTFTEFQRDVDGPLQRIRDQLKKPKPLFFSETGWNVVSGRTHAQQAAGLVKKITFARARGAVGFTWFALAAGGFKEWNIIDPASNAPRPAFCAYNELSKILRGKAEAKQHDAGEGNWLFSFSGDRETAFVGWNEDAPTDGQKVLIALPRGGCAETFDLMGNAAPADSFEGVIAWPLDRRPSYLRVSGGDASVHGPLVSFADEPYALPSVPVQLTAMLRNPLPQEAVFELHWIAPGGKQQQEKVAVPAAGAGTAEFRLPMPAVKPDEPASRVQLGYRVAKTPWEGTLELTLHAAGILVSAQPMDARPPDFTLDTAEHIFNANQNDPNRAEWAWKGPSDLSAKVWLGLDGNALLLKVDVSDERHMQPHAAGSMWQADSIQIGIHVPGRDGSWELGLARHDDGDSLTHCWRAPAGFDQSYAGSIRLTTHPRKGGVVYRAHLPLVGLGADADFLCRKAVGFNLIVNDEDGGKREGFAFLAPGLGRGTQVKSWPLVTFEKPKQR